MSRSISEFGDDVREKLESQVAELGAEVRALRKSLSRRRPMSRVEDARDGAAEIFEEVWGRIADALPSEREMRRHAKKAKRTARENPAAIVVGVAVLGLLASLLFRR